VLVILFNIYVKLAEKSIWLKNDLQLNLHFHVTRNGDDLELAVGEQNS